MATRRARATPRTSARSPWGCTRTASSASAARLVPASMPRRGASCASGSRRSKPTPARSTRARSERASCERSVGSGRRSSSAPSWAAGRAMVTFARPPTRGWTSTRTRGSSCASEPSRPPKPKVPPKPRSPAPNGRRRPPRAAAGATALPGTRRNRPTKSLHLALGGRVPVPLVSRAVRMASRGWPRRRSSRRSSSSATRAFGGSGARRSSSPTWARSSSPARRKATRTSRSVS